MAVTFGFTVFLDLITAVALGLIVAALASARQFERLELDSVMSTPLLDRSFLGTTSDGGVDDRRVRCSRRTATIVVGLRGTPAVSLNGLGALRHVPQSHFVETLDEARDLAARILTVDD